MFSSTGSVCRHESRRSKNIVVDVMKMKMKLCSPPPAPLALIYINLLSSKSGTLFSSHGRERTTAAPFINMDANIVVMGTESVGKSGKHVLCNILMFLDIISGVFCSCMSFCCCFSALTVRLLTRRFIGEYGDIGKCIICFLRRFKNATQAIILKVFIVFSQKPSSTTMLM